MRAYLDIETTYDGSVSVVGIHVPGRPLVQLCGGQVSDLALASALEGVEVIVTFNGTSFDLPVIRRRVGIDLRDLAEHRDLRMVCRRRGIRGGLKRVETLFGIVRTAGMVEGALAPYLWARWEEMGDSEALETLLAYNREDCVNLEVLENILDGVRD